MASTRTRSPPISPSYRYGWPRWRRDHEFTFLDHALKSGESLVGLTQVQIAAAHWDTSKPGLPLFGNSYSSVSRGDEGPCRIQAAPDDTARAISGGAASVVGRAAERVRLMGEAVIAAFFAEDKPKAREKKRAEVESWLSGSPVTWDKLAALAATLKHGTHPLTPFHWEIEFPECLREKWVDSMLSLVIRRFLVESEFSTENGDALRGMDPLSARRF